MSIPSEYMWDSSRHMAWSRPSEKLKGQQRSCGLEDPGAVPALWSGERPQEGLWVRFPAGRVDSEAVELSLVVGNISEGREMVGWEQGGEGRWVLQPAGREGQEWDRVEQPAVGMAKGAGKAERHQQNPGLCPIMSTMKVLDH